MPATPARPDRDAPYLALYAHLTAATTPRRVKPPAPAGKRHARCGVR